MGDFVGINGAHHTESRVFVCLVCVDNQHRTRAHPFADINTQIGQTGIKTDHTVGAINIAFHINGLFGNSGVGVHRSALAFLTVGGDGLAKFPLDNGCVNQNFGGSYGALSATGIELEFPHKAFSILPFFFPRILPNGKQISAQVDRLCCPVTNHS